MEYDSDKIKSICDKIDLLQYIQRKNDVEKSGKYYYCSCNNNSDTTPSLCIYPETNSFYCYSCSRGGNLLNYMMTHEKYSFKDALNEILSLANVSDLSEIQSSNSLNFYKKMARAVHVDKKMERQILDFKKCYLDKYKPEPIIKWQEEGIEQEVMNKFNIRIDHNANRIIYPIFDFDKNYLGWKGRTLLDDKIAKQMKIPKYKLQNLVGSLNVYVGNIENCDNAISNKKVILLEGIKSVMHISSKSWGYDFSFSTEGCYLGEDQMKYLLSLNLDEVIIAYDKDKSYKSIVTQKYIKLLSRFTKVSVMIDRYNLLGEKDSPCDKGKAIFDKLYNNRMEVK